MKATLQAHRTAMQTQKETAEQQHKMEMRDAEDKHKEHIGKTRLVYQNVLFHFSNIII